MLADRIALKRSQNNEEQLYKQLTKFFNRLKKEVLKALEEYWSDYQLFQGQVNLICSPVHEAHREYYEILEKYKKREYRLGVKEAERQVKNENRKHKIALKAVQTFPISSFIKKDKDALFGTLPSAERDMLNKTFTASERTLSRVDSQINQIITDGYRQGYGINQIANDLTRRFDQLSTWESKRIARTEIHGSHNTAVMDTYRDMDVEYIQWDAAGDDRTRDSHVEIDGEIIPIGSTFSNGLQFPGDTSGPIEEWINCRCSNAPFVIPYGFIAPSFSPFKESDLIPVTQETLQEPTQEQLNSNLTDEQRMEYNKLKADMKLAEDIINSPFYTEREKSQAITSYQQNAFKLNQLKQIAHGKLAEGYANLIKPAIISSQTGKPDSQINKFQLTPEQQLRLQELQNADKLGLAGRSDLKNLLKKQEFNELHNKKLTNKLSETENVQYNKLYNELTKKKLIEPIESIESARQSNMPKVFDDPNFFKLSAEEIARREELMSKTRDKTITREEKFERRDLGMRERIQQLHEKLLTKGLDVPETHTYLSEYAKLKENGMTLPEIPIELKFSTPTPAWEQFSYTTVEIGNKYTLSETQAKQLYELEKKKLLSEENLIKNKITNKELRIIEELQNQRQFNYLYYVREKEGGLTYEHEVKFRELYHKFEKKLKLDKNLISQDHTLPKYDHNIKPGKIDKDTNIIKMKGTSEDGLPPGHEIKDLFTIDVTKTTINEQRVVTRWMGNDFVYFRDFVVRSKGDINAYIDYVLKASDEQLKHYGYIKTMIEEGKIKEVKAQIRDIAKSIEHDLPVLDNILNNNMTKKAMTLWRKETKHHLGEDPKPGDIITLPGKNSTSITLEGAEHFAEVTNREMKWTYEIEAPIGTRGAYVSHLNLSEKIRMEMEYLLADDTQMTITKFDPKNHYAKLRVITY